MWVQLYAFLILGILFIGDVTRYKRTAGMSKVFLKLQVVVLGLLLIDSLNHQFYIMRLEYGWSSDIPVKITSSLGYIFFYMTMYYFCLYIQENIEVKRKVSPVFRYILLIVCNVYGIMWGLSPFIGVISGTVRNENHQGILSALGRLGPYIVLAIIAMMLICYHSVLSIRNALILSSFVMIPFISALISRIINLPSLLWIAVGISMMVVHVSIFRNSQLTLEEQKLSIAQNRVRILQSQIGPHFMFNILNAIYVLCEKDPETAQLAVNEFSEYMRGNLQVLEDDSVLPFDKEMQHVDHYLRLEKLRYRDDLEVKKNIQVSDFKIPPLSIQPLVENAVGHGIGRKKGGGIIEIKTYDNETENIIEVSDNGVGFDTAILDEEAVFEDEKELKKGHMHIGLKNVRERLSVMSGGNSEISSEHGKGTVVVIRLPKKR